MARDSDQFQISQAQVEEKSKVLTSKTPAHIQCERHENRSEPGNGYVGSLKVACGAIGLWAAIMRFKPDATKQELSTYI
ncbi:MAG TPA: hypothetical protein VFY40_05170 [Blastocatellia bacterium]|nr:hypothetical protein [Blastocatellia bacterium]